LFSRVKLLNGVYSVMNSSWVILYVSLEMWMMLVIYIFIRIFVCTIHIYFRGFFYSSSEKTNALPTITRPWLFRGRSTPLQTFRTRRPAPDLDGRRPGIDLKRKRKRKTKKENVYAPMTECPDRTDDDDSSFKLRFRIGRVKDCPLIIRRTDFSDGEEDERKTSGIHTINNTYASLLHLGWRASKVAR